LKVTAYFHKTNARIRATYLTWVSNTTSITL